MKRFLLFCLLAIIFTVLLTVTYHGVIGIIAGVAGCVTVSLLSFLLFVRWLSSKAYSSLVFGELFSFITGYKLKAFVERTQLIAKEDMTNRDAEYKNLILILKQQGFTKYEAKEAAEFALDECELYAPFNDKIYKAIQYHGSN